MEDTAVQSTETGQGTPDTGQPVSQSSYINDAWDTKYFRSHEAELNPDKVQQKQAQTPKEHQKVEPKKVEAKQQAETPKKPEAKQPDKQEPQRSKFEDAFAGEDGELDLGKIVGYNLPEETAALKADIGQAQPEEKPVTHQERWQKDQEEISTLDKTLRAELLNPLQQAFEKIQGGTDPFTALNQVYLERKAIIENHIAEKKNAMEFERQKALEERMLSDTQSKAMQEQSKININEIASSLPGGDEAAKTALYNEIMFGMDAGAQVLDYYFREKVEGVDKMTPAQKNAAAIKFVNSITSDKAKLRFVFNQAMALKTRQHLPKLMQSARMAGVAQHKSNALAAQKSPTGTTRRPAPTAKASVWDGYLNNHYETADRV